jgi:hypothetical protein
MSQSMYNSSIMIWYANENQDLYKTFVSNIQIYIQIYIMVLIDFLHMK